MKVFEIKRYEKNGTNSLGQDVYDWQTVHTLSGWLDMLTGEEDVSNAVLESSTHVFITKDLSFWVTRKDRLYFVDQKKTYEITFVDDPVNMAHHLEVYVKRVAE